MLDSGMALNLFVGVELVRNRIHSIPEPRNVVHFKARPVGTREIVRFARRFDISVNFNRMINCESFHAIHA